MPIYEYFCSKCKKEKEVLQKQNDSPPQCTCKNSPFMIKKISQTGGFILRGTGWYKTDYSKTKRKK